MRDEIVERPQVRQPTVTEAIGVACRQAVVHKADETPRWRTLHGVDRLNHVGGLTAKAASPDNHKVFRHDCDH